MTQIYVTKEKGIISVKTNQQARVQVHISKVPFMSVQTIHHTGSMLSLFYGHTLQNWALIKKTAKFMMSLRPLHLTLLCHWHPSVCFALQIMQKDVSSSSCIWLIHYLVKSLQPTPFSLPMVFSSAYGGPARCYCWETIGINAAEWH